MKHACIQMRGDASELVPIFHQLRVQVSHHFEVKVGCNCFQASTSPSLCLLSNNLLSLLYVHFAAAVVVVICYCCCYCCCCHSSCCSSATAVGVVVVVASQKEFRNLAL